GGGVLAGAAWAGLAAGIRLKRGVHEVLATLLLNFVGLLIVSEVLQGDLGEPGSGFPQSPLLPAASWLGRLVRGTDLHVGVAIALLGGLNPLAVLPAGLFFGFLETGAVAMQRAVGVPTPLVAVIQGLTMVFVLSAMGLTAGRRRV